MLYLKVDSFTNDTHEIYQSFSFESLDLFLDESHCQLYSTYRSLQ